MLINQPPLANSRQFEQPILNQNFFYEKVESLPDEPSAIMVFHNVVINPHLEKKVSLEGTRFAVLDTGRHYGHYIKESIGGFLYCKTKIPELVPFYLENFTNEVFKMHSVGELIKTTNRMLINDFGGGDDYFYSHFLWECNIHIEKLVVMMDNGKIFVPKQFPPQLENRVPQVSRVMVSYFNHLKITEGLYPKKIYISRKSASLEYRERLLTSDPYFIGRHFEDWLEDGIEDAFIAQGYTAIDFSGMPLEQQIKYSHNATHFAGIIGTAFHNGIFCEDGATFYAVRPNSRYGFDWEHDIVNTLNDVKFNTIDPWECSSYAEVKAFVTNAITLG